MRGKAKILNSQDDARVANLTNEMIIEMATISVRYDDAVYPEDYDQSLKKGDDGYIEPVYRNQIEVDQSVLDRFGVKND